MKIYVLFPILLILITYLSSCNSGPEYLKMSEKTEKRNNFLVRQAHKITGKNIKNRKSNVDKQTKENKRKAKETQEANDKTSKVKKPQKHNGEFIFY